MGEAYGKLSAQSKLAGCPAGNFPLELDYPLQG